MGHCNSRLFRYQKNWIGHFGFLVASLFEGNVTEEVDEGRARFFEFYQQRASMSNVATMLMALSAAVMKADGKVLKAELDYVKNFFSQQFGNQFNREHLQVLKRFGHQRDPYWSHL